MSVKQEIITKFGPVADNEEIISKCESILNIFSINVEELFVKWETYNFHLGENLNLTASSLEDLIAYIQSGLEKKKTTVTKANNKMKIKSLSSSPSNMFNYIPSTPISNKKRKLETPLKNSLLNSSPVIESPIETPTKSVPRVIETLNPQIEESNGFTDIIDDETSQLKPVKIVANFDPSKYKFRTMRQKLLESADLLDDQIDSFGKIIQSHYNLPVSEFGNPCLATQFEIVAVGRIVPDSPLTDSNEALNSSSLCLETSRLGGIGQRIPLDLTSHSSYSFFPGQIVALRGFNPTGNKFIVKSELKLPYLGSSISSKEELEDFNEIQNGNGLKIITCSGPYTSNIDLDYTQLETLIEKFNNLKPHVVILMGPFIDITHPKIMDGSITLPELSAAHQPKTLDDLFKKKLTPIFKRINSKIQVILVPSLKDTISKHCSYPQDAIDRKFYGLPKNFKCFPNPSSFQINEVSVGISTNDIFKDLKDVNMGELAVQNRFERIANHVLEQRRYYPIFPGGLKIASKHNNIDEALTENISLINGSNLELPYLGLTEFNGLLPDILIIPSELNFFAKIIKDVIFINPGFLVKSNRPGSYGVISINKPDLEAGDFEEVENGMYLNKVFKRTRVDIVKL